MAKVPSKLIATNERLPANMSSKELDKLLNAIQQNQGAFGNAMSDIEIEERERVRREAKQQAKEHVLKIFSGLPNYMRQRILDGIIFTDAMEAVGGFPQSFDQYSGGVSQWTTTTGAVFEPSYNPLTVETQRDYMIVRIDKSIVSVEDFAIAHAQRCIEEGIQTKPETESK